MNANTCAMRTPEQAVDPPRRLDVECPFEQLVDEPRPAEDQDQSEADDERRRDDRQHGQRAQRFLEAEAGARDDQREREAERGRQPIAHSTARISVFHATPQRGLARDAAERPYFRREEPVRERVERQRAVRVLQRLYRRSAATGKNVNMATSTLTATTLHATNGSPLNAPRSAMPSGEQHREGRSRRSAAPSPMPVCATDTGPSNATSHACDRPRGPIAKPCASRYSESECADARSSRVARRVRFAIEMQAKPRDKQ